MVEVLPSLQTELPLSNGKYSLTLLVGVTGDSIELGVTLVADGPGFPGLVG